MTYSASVHAKATELTRLVVEMTAEAGSGHPSSAASLAHLVTVLLYDHMRFDPAAPAHPAADRLVLSEGHAVPIIYAAAADLGIAYGEHESRRMTRVETFRLREIDSELDGHPNPAEGFPFFPAATGSLGQGLSIALGIALAARMNDVNKRVFCIIGDGESREGQVWEALDMLVERDLRSVLPIFNCNALGQTGAVSEQQRAHVLAEKLYAFGLEPEVIDGHEPAEIVQCLDRHREGQHAARARPIAIVAQTIKGWGMPSLQGTRHHGKPLEGEDATRGLRELEDTARDLGAAWTDGEFTRPELEARIALDNPDAYGSIPSFAEALRLLDREDALEDGMATREAYGVALRFLGHARPDLVVLDGDVGNSTHSGDVLEDPDLADRLIQCYIAEQNMVSVAAGLCSEGMRPIASTFGKFVTRAYDQIEMALISGFPMRIVGSHVGVSPAADGPSQMALTDVSFFHSLGHLESRDHNGPLIYTLTPCDPYAAYALTNAMVGHEGASYLRTMRSALPSIYDDETPFMLGGHRLVAPGKDLLIAAWGFMVHEALAVRDELAQSGIEAAVVDLYSLPFDGEAFAELCTGSSGGKVLTLEDNFSGGLSRAVRSALLSRGGSVRVVEMCVRRMPKSGRSPREVLAHVGLSREEIAQAAIRLHELPAEG